MKIHTSVAVAAGALALTAAALFATNAEVTSSSAVQTDQMLQTLNQVG